MTETPTNCDEEDVNDICEDGRCITDDIQSITLWYCVRCDSTYCSNCWSLQGPHRPKKRGPEGLPHEKVDLSVVRRLRSILHPSTDPLDVRKSHQEDDWTKWFGVTRDEKDQVLFDDYGRYATLVSDIARSTSMKTRYPQLVSFVGVTNAGKSTLIKMLIHGRSVCADINGNKSDKSDNTMSSCVEFPSPVVGSLENDSLATSGDVHLYADPTTHADPLPVLYADCEGFEGGERSPLGSQPQLGSGDSQSATTRAWVNTRRVRWADTEEHRRREYAVTVLYPRLLYSFSDCVAFVLRNPKTFGSAALTKLLEWGAAALEKSINQPALPHCIVVLNGSHPGIDPAQWDSHHATESLLSSVSNAFERVEGVPQFRQLADHWRGLGREISSVKDLILCYYASFKVLRVPAAPQYMLLSQQVDKLHAAIRADCRASHEAKRRARLLVDADELNLYIQSGFDHFTTHIEVPFNFMQVSLRRNPIPQDFGGHILQLCESLSARMPSRDPARVESVFGKLSVVLASCVLLDCARFRKGQLHEFYTILARLSVQMGNGDASW
ncbi:hypothetical protein WHR41_09394 [Cladosporium halotolerans]|uniref:B box-type domain-containing protein n=1 Tax=Cladosporium halotolerans TaxID=1052096 RepID=A0AB34KAJ9_9PEZI